MSSEEENVILVATNVLIGDSCKKKKKEFWIRLSLKNRKMYSASDLTKDLILNDVDELNLEYRYDMGFKNQLKKKTK